ncbi:TadE/TadG family type IV pilus assembly protein [Methylobacterium sp. M6A4_1b]
MPAASCPCDMLCNFLSDCRGTFAVWFGVMLIPVLLIAGGGLDMMRAVQLRSELQTAADSAALAGASVYISATASSTAQATATRFMANAIARMPYASNVTFTVTPSVTSAAVYSVALTAQARVPNSILSMVTSETAVTVISEARSAGYKLSFSLSSFASNSADANSIYWYVVPANNGIPGNSDLNLLFSNTSSSISKDISAIIGTGQKIGFALQNVTGGISSYGRNGYGATPGSSHIFYSHLVPPSSAAYTLQLFNCSLQTTTQGGLLSNGFCSLGAPSNATVNCNQTPGRKITYKWNDMGGAVDDKDYNDAVFNVTCPSSLSGADASNSVVLTR